MKKGLILLVSALLLLLIVSCNSDPNIYKYDSSTYLGSWEVDIAPIQGDVDGCIQLQQYTFNSDFSYELVEFIVNKQTNEITINDGADGFYTYNYNANTGIGTIQLDGGGTRFYWNQKEGLTRLILGVEFKYSRPNYVIRKAADQTDIVGIWEHSNDDKTTDGTYIKQLIFNSDGSFDIYYFLGTDDAWNAAYTKSWKYLDASVPKPYSVSYSMKWDIGSDIVVSGAWNLGDDLHENQTYFAYQRTRKINDNGVATETVLASIIHEYKIYECGGDKYLADLNSGETYKKVSSKIDLGKKNKEIVKDWENALGDYLYLRSDGTFYSEIDLFDQTATWTGDYYGTYTENLSVTTFESYLAYYATRLKELDPATYDDPGFDWVTWRAAQTAAYTAALVDNDIVFYSGTVTFDGEYCLKKGGESIAALMIKTTPKYGLENPNGEPVPDYSFYFKLDEGVYVDVFH